MNPAHSLPHLASIRVLLTNIGGGGIIYHVVEQRERRGLTQLVVVHFHDLAGIADADLRLLRNMVYARHGRIFDAPDLQRYFSPRQITDISLASAYYLALGACIVAFDVELEPPEMLQTELDWQRKQSAAKSP